MMTVLLFSVIQVAAVWILENKIVRLTVRVKDLETRLTPIDLSPLPITVEL